MRINVYTTLERAMRSKIWWITNNINAVLTTFYAVPFMRWHRINDHIYAVAPHNTGSTTFVDVATPSVQ